MEFVICEPSCVNVYIGFCIATMDDDRYGLGNEKYEKYVDLYMSMLFSKVLSPSKTL